MKPLFKDGGPRRFRKMVVSSLLEGDIPARPQQV
jgi:hypothetical protein